MDDTYAAEPQSMRVASESSPTRRLLIRQPCLPVAVPGVVLASDWRRVLVHADNLAVDDVEHNQQVSLYFFSAHGALGDDAFAYSDPDRVQTLQRMLYLAASRGLQVIVLTCAPSDYAALGATHVTLRLEKSVPTPSDDRPLN